MEQTATSALVVQHNALINARFNLSTVEMRFFLAMLSHITRDDKVLPVCRIHVSEICPDSKNNSLYADVRQMVDSIVSRTLTLEVLGPNGERLKKPDYTKWPLMGRASYVGSEGVVVAAFNDHLRPYLVELKNNFTKAQLGQLLKLKSPTSHRIYWLLREFAAFGKRTISVAELREVLELTDKYNGRFDHFRTRILDRAQKELEKTDMAFTYETSIKNRAVNEITFHFSPTAGAVYLGKSEAPAVAEHSWQALLLGAGVSAGSLPGIAEQLAADMFDEGYITYVVSYVRERHAVGKVKKPAGAIFKAITTGYLLADYRTPANAASAKLGTPKTGKGAATTSGSQQGRALQRLRSNLDDKNRSRAWLIEQQNASPAKAAQWDASIAEVNEDIRILKQQIAAG